MDDDAKPDFTPAGPADSDLLVELMREFYEFEQILFDEAVVRRALCQLLGDRTYGVAYLIRVGGRAAGYCVLTFGFSLEFHGRDALIDELYLREGYRGRGLGMACLEHVEAVCAGEGIRAIHLLVARGNPRARSVYARAGYLSQDRDVMTKWTH